MTKALKDMILAALESVGGEEYLVRQARGNSTAFLQLLGKILPHEIKTSMTPAPQSFVKVDLEALGRVTIDRDSASSDQGGKENTLVRLGDAP